MAEEYSNYYLGYLGIASAVVLSTWGAAYGSYKSAAGIFNLGTSQHENNDRQQELLIGKGNKQINGSQNASDVSARSYEYQHQFSETQNNTHYTNKCLIPVVMSGVLAVYGLIIGVILVQKIPPQGYTSHMANSHLSSGLCAGFANLLSGIGIGILGQNGIKAVAKQVKLFVPLLCMLIFTEAIGLYGLIISLIIAGN